MCPVPEIKPDAIITAIPLFSTSWCTYVTAVKLYTTFVGLARQAALFYLAALVAFTILRNFDYMAYYMQ